MTTFIEPFHEEMPLIGGYDTIYWLCKWHHRRQKDKSIFHEY